MNIREEDTIAEIVKSDYRTAKVFKSHGLDFCCGGKKPLNEACEENSLEVNSIIDELMESMAKPEQVVNFDSWTNTQLIKHIVEIHHSYIEDNVPYLSQLLNKIANVHGERHPELIQIRDIYDEATDALYDHMKKEEIILFPAIEAMEQAESDGRPLPPFGFGQINNPIQAMEHEHDFEGDAFKKIAALSNNFTPPADACSTYTVAFAKLKEFVDDLHRHIHLENNVLFENAKKLEAELTES